jgi:hypothetical protein
MGGIEPPTFRLTAERSTTELHSLPSIRRGRALVGIEPTTSETQTRNHTTRLKSRYA